MSFQSLKDIATSAAGQDKPFFRIILEDDMSERMVTEEESFAAMKNMYSTMRAADESYDGNMKSASGLVGNDGQKMEDALKSGKAVSGSFMGEVMVRALKMGESNACMKRIVAAPTAGSCGVMPAVFLTYQKHFGVSDEKMTEAMFTAAGIGTVIAERAFIAGATGGCQAEIGSASAMAAGGLAYLMGGGGNHPCQRHCLKKPVGPGLRPCGGFGGSALRQAERNWGGQCRYQRRHGNGRDYQPHPPG